MPGRSLKERGGWGGGGGSPPIMIEQVMIQLKERGDWGGGQQPPYDDRKSDDSIRGKESKKK